MPLTFRSNNHPHFRSTVPVLASLNIAKTVEFYQDTLGFRRVYEEANSYAIMQRDTVEFHFWACDDKYIAENSGCRVNVTSIDSLHDEYQQKGIVHPQAPLTKKPWGTREFGILDLDGNLITFFERERKARRPF